MHTRRYILILLVMILAPAVANCASGQDGPSLMDPASLNETAPDEFQALFETSAGDFVVEVTREWAPNGADRFYNLVKGGFFDECRFFRVVDGFMVQFGISGDPAVQAQWAGARIAPDPVRESNERGFITYAMAGSPDTRTSQVFINFGNNDFLDNQGFAPFGEIIDGMDVVDDINSEYGERPQQPLIQSQGNTYLNRDFPDLDYIISATIVE